MGVTKKQTDLYMSNSGIVAEKVVDGYTYKLHRAGFTFQIDCYMPNGNFSHIVAMDINKERIEYIWNNLKTY